MPRRPTASATSLRGGTRTAIDVRLLLPQSRPVAPGELLDLYDAPGPYVRAGMLVSLDGSTSHAGRAAPLQTPPDGVVFTVLREVADAILVGAGTVRAEEYGPVRLSDAGQAWRRTRERATDVPLVVVSRSLGLPEDTGWLDSGRSIVVTCASSPDARREELSRSVEVLVCGRGAVDLRQAQEQLAERGLRRLLCEGGPSLLTEVADAGLLTEVCATVSPLLAGGAEGMLRSELRATVDLELVHLLHDDSTLLGRWRVVPAYGSGE